MTETDHPARVAAELSPTARRLYARITRDEPVRPEDTADLRELIAWRLVVVDPDHPERPIALDPQEAGRRRIDEELRDMAGRAAQIAAIPALSDELGLHFARARWRSGSSSEFLADGEQVAARVCEAVDRAEGEVLAADPHGARAGPTPTPAAAPQLARGVALRALYGDSARDDAAARDRAAALSAAGARLRTLAASFQRCVVVDRRQAFIADHVVGAAPSQTAWHVTDRALVAYIAESFEDAWRRADVWYGDPRKALPADGDRLTPSAGDPHRHRRGRRPAHHRPPPQHRTAHAHHGARTAAGPLGRRHPRRPRVPVGAVPGAPPRRRGRPAAEN